MLIILDYHFRVRNSSAGRVLASMSFVMQRRELIKLWACGRGDFSLEVNMGSDSIT